MTYADLFCYKCFKPAREKGINTIDNEKHCRTCGAKLEPLTTGELPEFYRRD